MLTRWVILAASLMLSLSKAMADGKEVTILLRSGEVVKAELIAVRNDGLLVSPVSGLSDAYLFTHLTSVERVPREEIQQVTIGGKSYVLVGAAIGLTVGAITGAVIGGLATSTEKPKNIGDILLKPVETTSNTAIGLPTSPGCLPAGALPITGSFWPRSSSTPSRSIPPTTSTALRRWRPSKPAWMWWCLSPRRPPSRMPMR